MSQQEILKIRCKGAGALDIKQMEPIQGELKKLATQDKDDFKRRLKKKGFTDPIMIWTDGGKNKILSGTQRWTVLMEMRNEGFVVPPVPVNFVEAANLKEAKDHLLDYVSQYGKVTEQGLFDFLQDNLFSAEELAEFKIPEFDMLSFIDKNMSGIDDDLLDISPLDAADGDDPVSLPDSHIRMQQLFFNEEQSQEFLEKIKMLQETFGKQNVTDTVLEVVRESYSAHFPQQ